MKKYRKKPLEVAAWQWDNELEAEEIALWCDGQYDPELAGGCGPSGEDWGDLTIDTLEGTMTVSPYDYVIQGVSGEFYPCKPDIFEKSYEEIRAKSFNEMVRVPAGEGRFA